MSYVIDELLRVYATIRMLFLYHLNKIRYLFRITSWYFKFNLYLTLIINQLHNLSSNVINIKQLNDSMAYLKLSCLSHTFNISISRNDITHHEFVVLSLTTTRNADSRRVKNKYAHMNKRNVRIFMNELKYLHLFPYNHIDQESKPKMCDIPLYYFYLFFACCSGRITY